MTFVLVHGAFQGGWCWKKVRRILEDAGREVFTPSLTGLGDRSHLLHACVDLQTHINDIANLLTFEDLKDVVLVGHSYGGMVVTGVADVAGDRIRQLVYLDALSPASRQSSLDILDRPVAELIKQLAVHGWRVEPPVEALLAYFAIEDPADRSWMSSRFTAQSLETFQQPYRESNGKAAHVSKTFIRSTLPSSGPAYYQAGGYARDEGWDYFELATAHEAMVTMPQELADILLRY